MDLGLSDASSGLGGRCGRLPAGTSHLVSRTCRERDKGASYLLSLGLSFPIFQASRDSHNKTVTTVELVLASLSPRIPALAVCASSFLLACVAESGGAGSLLAFVWDTPPWEPLPALSGSLSESCVAPFSPAELRAPYIQSLDSLLTFLVVSGFLKGRAG